MLNNNRLIVSHAPFLHIGTNFSVKNYTIFIAAFIAVIPNLFRYGAAGVGVLSLSISTAILWELLFNYISKQEVSIGDGNAALIGLLFAMMVPATMPWWAVLTGTFFSVIIGKQIFGGIGSNPFNPALIGVSILMISWKHLFDFDEALLNYDFDFLMLYPIAALKHFGVEAVDKFELSNFFLGFQSGGIGTTCGLAIIIGGIFLILKGYIRWEISLSFFLGIVITALIFNISDPTKYAGPIFHIFTGYTLLGIFFLATEDSSSPVNMIPMFIYGAGCGLMTILIRNIGAFPDGVVYAILLMNLLNPLIDKIRPKPRGKV